MPLWCGTASVDSSPDQRRLLALPRLLAVGEGALAVGEVFGREQDGRAAGSDQVVVAERLLVVRTAAPAVEQRAVAAAHVQDVEQLGLGLEQDLEVLAADVGVEDLYGDAFVAADDGG